MIYPYDKKMDPVKRAVILYAICLFNDIKDMFCRGENGAGSNVHVPIEKNMMNAFLREVVEKKRSVLAKCIETPHVFAEDVFDPLEKHGGVEGWYNNNNNNNNNNNLRQQRY